MKKLELKEASLYLPYSVRFIHDIGINELNIETINYWFTNYYNNPKLILKPLSNLQNLRDNKTPINESTINTLLGYGDIEFSHYKGDLDIIYNGDSFTRYDKNKTIPFNTFELIRNELLKGHYDIFGLIEKGLAIDINTLEK